MVAETLLLWILWRAQAERVFNTMPQAQPGPGIQIHGMHCIGALKAQGSSLSASPRIMSKSVISEATQKTQGPSSLESQTPNDCCAMRMLISSSHCFSLSLYPTWGRPHSMTFRLGLVNPDDHDAGFLDALLH